MDGQLFAGISVADYQAALPWYERFFGKPPAFFPNDVEAVWELSDKTYIYVEHRPQHAGHALVTVFVDDFDEVLAGVRARGIEPALEETYDNGVRKATFRDDEGNEIGLGGGPA